MRSARGRSTLRCSRGSPTCLARTIENAGAGTPMGRNGKPEEVARVVVWLCTDAASYVTGVAMPVDGGYEA